MYDQTAQTRLREKIGYELWLLDFISETQETFEGGADISTITLTNRQLDAHIAKFNKEALGSEAAIKLMNAMSPLTFTASYKILDMVFEWILEENHDAGNIGKPTVILVSIMLNAARRFLNPAQGERHDNCYDPTLINEPNTFAIHIIYSTIWIF